MCYSFPYLHNEYSFNLCLRFYIVSLTLIILVYARYMLNQCVGMDNSNNLHIKYFDFSTISKLHNTKVTLEHLNNNVTKFLYMLHGVIIDIPWFSLMSLIHGFYIKTTLCFIVSYNWLRFL